MLKLIKNCDVDFSQCIKAINCIISILQNVDLARFSTIGLNCSTNKRKYNTVQCKCVNQFKTAQNTTCLIYTIGLTNFSNIWVCFSGRTMNHPCNSWHLISKSEYLHRNKSIFK